MMRAASRFRDYSARNVMPIQAQRLGTTRVDGFSTWKQLGWHVRKGAKGVAIFAPCLCKHDVLEEIATARWITPAGV